MATLINNKVTFSGGETLPQVGSEAYKQAQQGTLPTSSYTNTPVNTTIDSSSLGNVTPMKLSSPSMSNGAVGLSAEITGNINNEVKNDDVFQAQIAKQAKERETALASSKKSVMERLGLVKGQKELTDEAYSQKNELGTTVNETSKVIRDTNAKINAVDIRTNEQLKALESNPQGLFGGALEQERNKIIRTAATNKADLYIDKLMAQGDYDTAKSIADRKIDVILEQDRIDLDKLKFDYEENKDLYTKAEQRQFETMQADRERALKKKDTELKTVEALALDALRNGAPTSIVAQMRKEGTVDSAIRTGGQYVNAIARNEAKIKRLLENKKLLGEDTTVTSSPLVNAMVNVNAGSAEGQQKRDTERIAQFVKNGQTKEAQNLILSRVTSKMSAGEREAELDRRNTIDALSDMKSALDEYVSVSGDTNILKGGIENVANKIGTTSDPKLASIKARIVQATQKYRNAITGAAWGDQETAEYKAIFPSITNTNKLNGTIIETMIPLLKNNERNAIGLFLGGSDVYDSIFNEQSKTTETSQPVKVDITPDDNAIFNSIVKLKTPTKELVEPTKIPWGGTEYKPPSFNISSFFN